MVSVGPTKDLNTHNIRLRQIYFHLTLLIRYFVRIGLEHKMADNTAFYLGSRNAILLLSPASILP